MPDFLDAHLNLWWLRPESALWDAIASEVIAQVPVVAPALDLGSGNGLFSFVTAGGALAPEYDWHRNVSPDGFTENRDVYDTFLTEPQQQWIIRAPSYRFDCAVDAKWNLLRQALGLGFYRDAVVADANGTLPLLDESFQTIFSNILYWLDSPEAVLREIRRLLRPRGHALLCMQDPRFKEYCISYQWQERESGLLRLLNRGRSESSHWTITYDELVDLIERIGFRIAAHQYYLSPLTLRVWDIGLRPLTPVLTKMVQKLTEPDRLAIKQEWIELLRPYCQELYELDRRSTEQGGYHFVSLERI